MPAPLEATMFAIIPEQPEVGDVREKVWTHLSVMPWVRLGDYREEVLGEVEDMVSKSLPMDLRPGKMMNVGGEGHEKRAQRIHSERIGKYEQLKQLHIDLLYKLGSFGIMVSHPEWAGPNYTPHITYSEPMLIKPTAVDKLYVIDNIAIVEGHKGTKLISKIIEGQPDET